MLKRLSTIKFTDESSLFNHINKDKLELNDSFSFFFVISFYLFNFSKNLSTTFFYL